jgi:hypothetical protein
VQVVADIEMWIYKILFVGLLALRVWALIDCGIRKAAAFSAAGKLTKPAWLALNLFSVVISFLLGEGYTLQLLTLGLLIVTLVYLADVRPAVREISGGNNRW